MLKEGEQQSGISRLKATLDFESRLLKTIPPGPHHDEFEDRENGRKPLHDLSLRVEWNKLDGITPSHWNGYVQPGDIEFIYHFYHGEDTHNKQYSFTEHAGRILARKEQTGLQCIAYRSGATPDTQKLDDIVNPTARKRAEVITEYILRNMQKRR